MTSGAARPCSRPTSRASPASERDLVPISLAGSLFAVRHVYRSARSSSYFGFEQVGGVLQRTMGYDAAGAGRRCGAVTNPGRVARAGGRRGGARHHLPVPDEGGDVELHRRRERGVEPRATRCTGRCSSPGRPRSWCANAIGLAFILGNILDQVNAFMSYGSILTIVVVRAAHHRLLHRARARWASARAGLSTWTSARRPLTGAAWARSLWSPSVEQRAVRHEPRGRALPRRGSAHHGHLHRR